jgi:hypothetical protein
MAMFKVVGFPAAVAAAVSAALVVGNSAAFAYTSGTIGYDIGYIQCSSYPAVSHLSAAQVPSPWRSRLASVRIAAAASPQFTSAGGGWWTVPQQSPAPGSPSGPWYRSSYSFGIIGVDSGYPFMSAQHPGNPCLSSEYNHTPHPGLYVNTGYDPSYTDSAHTTSSCSSQSAAIAGSAPQQAAWAVGCSEAQGDYNYVGGLSITSPAGWWLDVETANSWCGQYGVTCDLSLNQYTLQGLIDTFTHLGAVPLGIYSNHANWTAIVGNLSVNGATSDWVASGTSTAKAAATYCASSFSFSGAPVSLVQFVTAAGDRDYAC